LASCARLTQISKRKVAVRQASVEISNKRNAEHYCALLSYGLSLPALSAKLHMLTSHSTGEDRGNPWDADNKSTIGTSFVPDHFKHPGGALSRVSANEARLSANDELGCTSALFRNKRFLNHGLPFSPHISSLLSIPANHVMSAMPEAD